MTTETDGTATLLQVEDLSVEFATDAGFIRVVDGVSLRVGQRQTVAIVGESGCGKSVTALSIMRLIPRPPGRIASGRILFHPRNTGNKCPSLDLLRLDNREIRRIRGKSVAMIFQEPVVSLNPVYTVGEQIVEAIELHQPHRGAAAKSAAIEALRKVGIAHAEARLADYPHEMSGGMLQRAMIAMALACEPSLLIADEPTTALDVTTQAQILRLLTDLQIAGGMSVLLITHDLGVVAQAADYTYVMYAGRIVEHAPTDVLFAKPAHPYTKDLMRCAPRLSQTVARLEMTPGSVPDPARPPSGCRFHPRCRLSAERAALKGRASIIVEPSSGGRVLRRCVESYAGEPSGKPPLRELGPGHFAACWEAE